MRSDIEFFLIPWHCLMYDNRFETLMPLLSADIGLVIPKTGNLMELAETQGATLRRKGGLNQPFLLKRGWSVDTRDLVEAAKIMKRPYLFFDSFCAGEDSNPVPFFPAPATVAGKVIEISSSSQDACGVVDFWGIDPRRLEVNEVVFQESLWRSPNENVEAVLSNTVRRRFSLTDKTIIAKIREAWEHLDQAFQKKWRVISFGQRLENCFYGWRDETFPPCPPAHEHEGFSAGPIAGDLMLKIATTSRFQRAEKELPYLTQQSATRFLQESQGAAATALYRAIAEIQEAIGSIEHHAIETHFNFLHAAAIHFETFANNFEAKGIIDDVSTGKQTEKQAIKQLVNIAQKEVSNWRWIESFVEKYGFEETYWPNELQRRLQIQEAWTTPAKWPQFFSNLKKKNS